MSEPVRGGPLAPYKQPHVIAPSAGESFVEKQIKETRTPSAGATIRDYITWEMHTGAGWRRWPARQLTRARLPIGRSTQSTRSPTGTLPTKAKLNTSRCCCMSSPTTLPQVTTLNAPVVRSLPKIKNRSMAYSVYVTMEGNPLIPEMYPGKRIHRAEYQASTHLLLSP